MLTWDELIKEIYRGEKIDMECKLAGKAIPQSVYETYCSFANSKGGNIVLGVEEDKNETNPETRFKIRGIAEPEKIRDEFDNIFMDYRDETGASVTQRWTDRVTYDGTWENNLFNFFMKVAPKLTEDLKKPFVLENMQRVDDTPVHEAIREAFVNLIIHSDYRMDAGVLKIIKTADGFTFTNPGSLKLPKEQIYSGGNSKARNPHMQTMLRMIGFGDNAGSGFPKILKIWADNGWVQPELDEDTVMNQVTLTLLLSVGQTEARVKESAESAEKSAESAEKSADSDHGLMDMLSSRQKEILEFMEKDRPYSAQEIADMLGIKQPRTRQLLNELISLDLIYATAATKNRRYMKK